MTDRTFRAIRFGRALTLGECIVANCADECRKCEKACRAMVGHASRLGN